MINIIIRVVNKEPKSIIRKAKEKLRKKKYWFMPESDKEVVKQRSLERYYRIKNK